MVIATVPAAPVIGVMTLGIVVALMGHISRNYKVVAVGLAVLFLATGFMVLGAFIDYHSGSDADPRKCLFPGTC